MNSDTPESPARCVQPIVRACACDACVYWRAYRARYNTLAANDLAELALVKPMPTGAVRARMRRMQIAGVNPHAGREGGKAGYMRALAAGYDDEIAIANMRLRNCQNKEISDG